MMIAFLIFVLFSLFIGKNTENYETLYFIKSIFLIQNWNSTNNLDWNVPSWSISTELFAYILFPILMILISKINHFFIKIIIIIATSFALHFYFSVTDRDFAGDIPQTGLVRCVSQFFMGMMICDLYKKYKASNFQIISLFNNHIIDKYPPAI